MAVHETVRLYRFTGLVVTRSVPLKFRRHIRAFHAYTRRRIHTMVKSQTFYWIVIVLVLMNTAVLASEYYDQPEWLTYTQGSVERMAFFLSFSSSVDVKSHES